MKMISMAFILLAAGMASASELNCRGRIAGITPEGFAMQDIKMKNTDAKGASEQVGEMLSGDLKLEVRRYLSDNATTLTISKKTNNIEQSYSKIASSQNAGLVEGQWVDLVAPVGDLMVNINCVLK